LLIIINFEGKVMKSSKGFTVIELMVILVIIGILLAIVVGGIVGIVCCVKGCNYVSDSIDNNAAAYTERLETNPPLFAVGDIVYHKATDGKMVVAQNGCSWNEVKGGWDIKVKDGGSWDKVGGFGINETEVKPTLEEVGR
jgi:prepilin-type N-terminal cleavage/methylation domain-containing protein